MKTTISLDDALMAEADQAAEEQGISRSRVLSLALQDYLKKRRGERITAQLNDVYKDYDQSEELRLAKFARAKATRFLDEW